jgi:hypothetical protein
VASALRLVVEAPEGALAANPEHALAMLADAAVDDGADRSEWIEKGIRSVGATSRLVPVSREPLHRVAADAVENSMRVYRFAMTCMRSAITERLERAAREADTRVYDRLQDRVPDGG